MKRMDFKHVPSPRVVQARSALERNYAGLRAARERLAAADERALDVMSAMFEREDKNEQVRARIRQNLSQNTAVR